MTLKILWGITGSGDKIEETLNVVKNLQEKYDISVRVVLSKNAELVIHMYGLWKSLEDNFEVLKERGPNDPFLAGPLQIGRYDLFVVCPATANTTAKIAHGIADSLISNCVSQTLKANRRVYIYPVDQKPGQTITLLPDGKELALTIREVDLENSQKLKRMRGLTVVSQLADIEDIVKTHLANTQPS